MGIAYGAYSNDVAILRIDVASHSNWSNISGCAATTGCMSP